MMDGVSTLPSVLVVSPCLDVGGTEMHLVRVLPELRRRGLDVSVFVLATGGQLEGELVRNNIAVTGPSGSLSHSFRAIKAVVMLRCQLRRLRPDIVHFFLPEPYLIGSFAATGMHMHRIMSRRSLAVYQKQRFILARFEQWLHHFTHVLLGNSTAVVAELHHECGDRNKIGLIYNGLASRAAVSPEERSAARHKLGIPSDAFVMAVVANFIAYKGHHDLFTALRELKMRFTKPWRLLLIGRDLGIGAILRRQAAELGFADNIIWIEDCVDVRVPLAAADAAVVPSHQEGFSNSLIEEMASGLAVVATRVGGNTDAVVDGESGLLVPVADPATLANAIGDLHDDTDLRQRLGFAARARVETLFSLDACVRQYLNLYSGVMRGGKSVQELIDGMPVSTRGG